MNFSFTNKITDLLSKFEEQQQELKNLLHSRENVVDFLSTEPEITDGLYEKADTALKDSVSNQSVRAREELIEQLNIHISQIAYNDSDKRIIHLRHITRLVPEFLASLSNEQRANIVQLFITGVHLKTLPDNISSLPNLEALFLNSNELKALPSALHTMTSLRSLNISDNQISVIDESVLRLPLLKRLDITNNPLSASELQKITQVSQEKQLDVTNFQAAKDYRK